MPNPAPRFLNARVALIGVPLLALALSACARNKGELVVDDGVGVTALRSACPAVGIPDYTGDVTLFDPPANRTVEAIDVTANITNLQQSCDEASKNPQVQVIAGFDVEARRSKAGPARSVTLPWFATVLRAGTQLESKQVGEITITFADGQLRGSGHASATAMVSRAAATLPPEILKRINRKRKSGDTDAALEAAIALSVTAAGSVTLMHRRQVFAATPATIARVDALLASGQLRFVAGQPSGLLAQDAPVPRLAA